MRDQIGPILLLASLTAGCFGEEATAFPPGLEPLEENRAPSQAGSFKESITFVSQEDSRYYWVHAKAYVQAPPGTVWTAVKNPDRMSASCDADEESYQLEQDPTYELAYRAHYVVKDFITVEWDEQWRFGTVEGTPDDPSRAIVRYQKIFGTTAIDLMEGSLQAVAVDDDDFTELQFIEHLSAMGGDLEDIQAGIQYRYDTILATVRGVEPPACPE